MADQPSTQSASQIDVDAWETMTNVEFRRLVDLDPDEAVFGFLRLQARVRALRRDHERGRQSGIQEAMRRVSSLTSLLTRQFGRLRWTAMAPFASLRARARALWHYCVKRHLYEICMICGRPVSRGTGPTWWSAPDDLWLKVNGGEDGVMCPACFTEKSFEVGEPIRWTAVRGV